MPIRAAYLRTSIVCVWCGSMQIARVGTLQQRCPNDCASGLGRAAYERINRFPGGQATDRAGTLHGDLIKGEFVFQPKGEEA